MNWKLTDKERQALNYFADYFNSLPLEQRKMLKQSFVRAQETAFLIEYQEGVIRKLKERYKRLMGDMLKDYELLNEDKNGSSNHS